MKKEEDLVFQLSSEVESIAIDMESLTEALDIVNTSLQGELSAFVELYGKERIPTTSFDKHVDSISFFVKQYEQYLENIHAIIEEGFRYRAAKMAESALSEAE